MACNLTYILSITGDCTNNDLGAFSLDINGSAPDYTIQWINPSSLGTIALGPGVTGYTLTDLSASTYTFNLIDSCEPNTVLPVNVYISSGTCVSVTGIEHTFCGGNNGIITATTQNYYGTQTFELYDSVYGYITSGSSFDGQYVFNGLSASTYYVIANDGGGCTGQTESVIIYSSATVDFTLFVVNDAGCAVNSGKIFVSGLTGNPPYTYLWSNGQTTSSISGLTTGFYNVTVTDSSGCEVNKSTYVAKVPPIGIASVLTTDPSCYTSDGEFTVFITGGTAPYNFSASTLGNNFTFDDEYTFTNVSSGSYNILVTDSALCNASTTITLNTPGGFSVVSTSYSPSVCGNSGFINVTLNGGSPPYVYTLTKSGGSVITQTTNSLSWSFINLGFGEYTLSITDDGPCDFTETITIENNSTFTLGYTVTGTTCGSDNGSIQVQVSGVSPTYTYVLDESEISISPLSSITYTNLTSGYHTVQVTDEDDCTQTLTILVDSSTGVDFIMTSTDSTIGNNGTINTYVTSGEPPFTLEWSSNVNGQTGFTLNSLSAGTYTLKITDDNGCIKIRSVIVDGNTVQESYQIYSVCDSDLTNSGMLLTKGPKQMLLEGFYDLNTGNTNCVLNESIFEAVVTISGVTKTDSFYTGNTLTEYPTIEEWTNVIEEIIMTYDGISGVTFNISKNLMTITTDCESEVSFNDAGVVINMKIYYDISCQSCTGCYTPEFIPISCEITEEYCETTETKVIYPTKWDIFGADYLNDLDIIPSRCTELPNYIDCNITEIVEDEFQTKLQQFKNYQAAYQITLSEGKVSEANDIPVVLPPSRFSGDSFYNGPDNVGWYQMNVIQGCSCKKIFEAEGLFGPEYDFDIVYLTEVQSYGDLPLSSTFGTYCWVIDNGEFYVWDPTSNTWVWDGTPIPGYPDYEFCAITQRQQRNSYLLALNQLMLAWRPFTWTSFHIPLYQIFKYKM